MGKVNLAGLLTNAIDCINPKKDTGGYSYMMSEVAGHIADVQSGKHTLAEFAEHYCITPKSETDTGRAVPDHASGPDRIWLIDDGQQMTWCDDPDPSNTGENGNEYVRADRDRIGQ